MVSILYGTGPGYPSLEVDATLTQIASHSVRVTRFPIETGANITDHTIREPASYRMTGIVTNTPAQQIPGDVTQMTGEEIDASIPWDPNRAASARDVLEGLKGQVVTVDTGPKLFENYVLESVEFPRDGETGDACRFEACFTEILTVSSQVAPVPNLAGGSKTSGGKKAAQPASDAVEAKSSAAVKTVDWAKNAAKKWLGIGG